MSKSNPDDRTSVDVDGNNSGQIAQGNDNTQVHTEGTGNNVNINRGGTQTTTVSTLPPAIADANNLPELLAALKAQVAAEAPVDKKDAAVGQINELEAAATAEKPDLWRMGGVKAWFKKNMPAGLSEIVSKAIVTPVMEEVMKGAGKDVFDEFQHLFLRP